MEDGSASAELLGQSVLAITVIHKWYIHYIHHAIRNILHVQAQQNLIRPHIYPAVLQILPTLEAHCSFQIHFAHYIFSRTWFI